MCNMRQKQDEKTLRQLTIESIKGALTPHQLGCLEAERGKLETWEDVALAEMLDSLNQ